MQFYEVLDLEVEKFAIYIIFLCGIRYCKAVPCTASQFDYRLRLPLSMTADEKFYMTKKGNTVNAK